MRRLRACLPLALATLLLAIPPLAPTSVAQSPAALMARAGLSFTDILALLTTNPARRFGLKKTAGRIAPGMEADLVVLEGDPARDLGALGRVRYTLRQGRVIYRRDGSESR